MRETDAIDVQRIRELRAEGYRYKEIGRMLGVSHHTVWKATTGRFIGRDGWVPSPDEIRESCRDIQAEWDAETERERRVVATMPWEAPELHAEV